LKSTTVHRLDSMTAASHELNLMRLRTRSISYDNTYVGRQEYKLNHDIGRYASFANVVRKYQVQRTTLYPVGREELTGKTEVRFVASIGDSLPS